MERDSARARFEAAALPLAGALYRMALALSRSDADAQDLVQETYFRAYRSFHTYAKDDNFQAWLFVILRNAWRDQCRRRRVEAAPPVIEEPVAPEPPAPVDLEGALPDELHRAFGALTPAHQMLLLLCDIQSMSYREAATVLDCPIGSVMSGLHNARKRLRALLAGK